MGLHKIVKNLGNKINTIQKFFATTTDYESRGQGFESSRAHHIQFTFGYKNKFNYLHFPFCSGLSIISFFLMGILSIK